MKFKYFIFFSVICLSFLATCFSYKLKNALNSNEVQLAGAEVEKITFGNKGVNVRFDTKKTAEHLNNKPINCFQFSTANPKKDYPGNLKAEINPENLRSALKDEHAIEIVFKKGVAELQDGAVVDDTKIYYIIGVMWYPGEFHFVRLFKHGWFSKPSKVGRGNWVTNERKLPSEAVGNVLKKQSGSKAYNFLGFFLHPNNDDYINQLLK